MGFLRSFGFSVFAFPQKNSENNDCTTYYFFEVWSNKKSGILSYFTWIFDIENVQATFYRTGTAKLGLLIIQSDNVDKHNNLLQITPEWSIALHSLELHSSSEHQCSSSEHHNSSSKHHCSSSEHHSSSSDHHNSSINTTIVLVNTSVVLVNNIVVLVNVTQYV